MAKSMFSLIMVPLSGSNRDYFRVESLANFLFGGLAAEFDWL